MVNNLSLLQAIEIIEHNHENFDDFHPQTDIVIKNAEKKLGISFPDSYKVFLKKYGYLGLGGEEINGLWNSSIIKHTLYQRQQSNNADPFPLSFVPIYNLGNGEIYCLDTDQMNVQNECPVVAWYFGRIEKISIDFGEFLLNIITEELENIKN